MRNLICAAAIALAAGTAMADFIAHDGRNHVRITMGACELEVPQKELMLAASAVIDGKDWKACWAPISREWLHIVYEDGDIGRLPFAAFKKLPEA
jgi:hypothetical protein